MWDPNLISLKEYTDALHEAIQRQLADIRHEREVLVAQFERRAQEQLDALHVEMDRRFGQQDRATVVAREELSKRLDGMNEIRGSLRDAQANQVNKDVFQTEVRRLEQLVGAESERARKEREILAVRVRDLESNSASSAAVEGYKRWLIATGLALIGLAAVVFFNFVRIGVSR